MGAVRSDLSAQSAGGLHGVYSGTHTVTSPDMSWDLEQMDLAPGLSSARDSCGIINIGFGFSLANGCGLTGNGYGDAFDACIGSDINVASAATGSYLEAWMYIGPNDTGSINVIGKANATGCATLTSGSCAAAGTGSITFIAKVDGAEVANETKVLQKSLGATSSGLVGELMISLGKYGKAKFPLLISKGTGQFTDFVNLQKGVLSQGSIFCWQAQQRVIISCFADGGLFSFGDCEARVAEGFKITGTLTN